MSGLQETLAKKVGPMPLGVWLLVGAGGLYIAYRGQNHAPAAAAPADTLPTGGGYGQTSYDGAPVVMSPIVNVAPAPVVITTPTPTQTPTPAPKPANPPKVPAPAGTTPRPTPPKVKPSKPSAVTHSYTVKSGDTLWAIARGNPVRVAQLYAKNRSVIEAAARKHGRSSSANGHWIYPGTHLVLPW